MLFNNQAILFAIIRELFIGREVRLHQPMASITAIHDIVILYIPRLRPQGNYSFEASYVVSFLESNI